MSDQRTEVGGQRSGESLVAVRIVQMKREIEERVLIDEPPRRFNWGKVFVALWAAYAAISVFIEVRRGAP